jgi:hypothetical protein
MVTLIVAYALTASCRGAVPAIALRAPTDAPTALGYGESIGATRASPHLQHCHALIAIPPPHPRRGAVLFWIGAFRCPIGCDHPYRVAVRRDAILHVGRCAAFVQHDMRAQGAGPTEMLRTVR